MVADRVAGGRRGTDKILVLNASGEHRVPSARRYRQTALAYRTRLSELKQEVGLGHFEGRGWRGFHHHATLCIAAYQFLISERETIPPSGTRFTKLFKEITIPEAYRPRGSAIAA